MLLLFGLGFLAISPLLAPGYFYNAHDGRHSVFYLNMFDASIRDGALWPRWAMHHIQGYGYPTFIIQAPLGFYLAELFVLLGAGYTTAVKWAWAVGFLMSGWGMYRLVLHWLEGYEALKSDRGSTDPHRLASVVAALLYIYLPYHLTSIYVRGAINDTTLLAWYPWVILAFDRLIIYGNEPGWQRRLAIALLSLGGTLLTHTFALISFAPFLVTFVLFRLVVRVFQDQEKTAFLWQRLWSNILLTGSAGIGALLLCANFLLPLLIEGQHLEQQVYVTDTYDFRNHFVYWGQFFNPFWGYGFSDDPTGVNDGMGFQVGAVALIILVVSIIQIIMPSKQSAHENVVSNPIIPYLILATIGLMWLMTPASKWLWEAVPPLAIIQFPWRLLALVILTISSLAGLTLNKLLLNSAPTKPYDQEVLGLLLVGLAVILASWPYRDVALQSIEKWREDGRAVHHFEMAHPDMIAYTEWVQEPFITSPMTPEYASDSYAEEAGVVEYLTRFAVVEGDGQVLSQISRGSSAEGNVQIESETATIQAHFYYFPGWQVRVDDIDVAHRVSNPYGLIEVDVATGQHQIEVKMGSTPVRRLGMLLSGLTLSIVLWLFKPKKP